MAGYTIAKAGKTAEVNLYGEVVSTRPTDWLTGEALPGDYICQDEFLQSLDDLKGMDEITVHLNSVGGELYVGLAICNRLRELPAKVTVVNDALAASAGSIILQGADSGRRLVKKASNTMVHQAASLLYGYYKEDDLLRAAKEAHAHNEAIVQAYVARTGRAEADIRQDLSEETWLTGLDAVALGYADAVDEDDAPTVSLSADRRTLNVGGRSIAASWLPRTLPLNLAVEAPQEQTIDGQTPHGNKTEGVKNMTIETVAQLREGYPELCEQLEREAAQIERSRLRDIDEIAGTVADAALLESARYGDTPMTAAELALASARQQQKAARAALNALQAAPANSGAAQVGTAANAPQASAGLGELGENSPEKVQAKAKEDWKAYEATKHKGGV